MSNKEKAQTCRQKKSKHTHKKTEKVQTCRRTKNIFRAGQLASLQSLWHIWKQSGSQDGYIWSHLHTYKGMRCTHIKARMQTKTQSFGDAHKHTNTFIHIQKHAHTHAHTHAHRYIWIHLHINTYKHIQRQACKQRHRVLGMQILFVCLSFVIAPL